MELTNTFQKIATGSSQTFGYATGYLELWAKHNGQDIAENKTSVTVELRLVVSGGYIGNYQATYWAIGGDLSNSGDLGSGDYRSTTLGSATGYITHNTDGTKSVSFSGSFDPTAWGQTLSVSGSADLPTIPRYANITLTTSNVTENSVQVSWSSDSTIDEVRNRTYLQGATAPVWEVIETNISKTSNTYTVVFPASAQTGSTFVVEYDFKRSDSQLRTEEATTVTTLDSVVYININGTWKKAIPYINVNGEWKKAMAYEKINGTWKYGKN